MIDFPNDPRGRELIRLIERLKYERWLANETDVILEAAFNQVVDLMLSARYRDLTQFQKQRAAELYGKLSNTIRQRYQSIAALHVSEMKAFAVLESQLTRDAVQAVLTASGLSISLELTLPTGYLASIAKLQIQGLNIGEWFDAQARTMTLETRRIIQQGLIEGKANAEIARRILAPAKAAGAVLSRRAKNEARILSRTIVNAVQNDAQMASLEALPESVSDAYVWESVLDSRTSDICRALSGRIFRYTDPKRRVPPAHLQCRSTIRALLRGIDQSLAEQRQPRTLKNYESWLRAQPNGVQNDILGPTRAGFFRNGKMSLADVIDADGRVLTLKELRARMQQMVGVQ